MSFCGAYKLGMTARVILAGVPFVLGSSQVAANDGTTAGIMKALPAEDRYPFIAGMIEATAYARYKEGGKDEKGMNCIYDWFYEKKGALDSIYVAFGEFPNHPPAAVLAALTKKVCAAK